MSEATVYLVDDDAAIRDALALLLSLKGMRAQVYANAEDFLGAHRPDWRGCLLTDLRMPGLSGLDLQRELQQRGSELPVVVLTAHGDVGTARAALKAGAFDFLEKPVDDQLLVDVLGHAIAHDAELHRSASERTRVLERLSRLTPREREVLQLLSQGLQNREIATQLQISPRTVEVYKARMMEKLDCRTLADVIRVGLMQEGAAAAAGPGSDVVATDGSGSGVTDA
ncbi:MAG: response regulator [Steroidobacteraceae bacterium]